MSSHLTLITERFFKIRIVIFIHEVHNSLAKCVMGFTQTGSDNSIRDFSITHLPKIKNLNYQDQWVKCVVNLGGKD